MIDKRIITRGIEIPSHVYADQTYVIKTDDGAWLCVMTTGEGREGSAGQFIITQRSTDSGKTWSDEVRLESGDSPENSWGVLLKGPDGRIYCFYIYNAANHRQIPADPGSPAYPDGFCRRVDSVGDYVFRYSDDNGKTWSQDRITIPVREFEIDRRNSTGGEIRYFWNVGKPFDDNGTAYVPLHKVGGFGAGFFTSSEGAVAASPDLFSVANPADASWDTLPNGDDGIRAPAGYGPVSEEHSFVVLSDGSFFTVFRTVSGYPFCSYSRDKGRSWSEPDCMRYADGRPMKHPRAANFVWRCANGRYLYWFHNNGGSYVMDMHSRDAAFPYNNRNPVWMSGGTETDSSEGKIISWSEPDIVLYDDDPMIRMSYPDLIEDDGKLYVTETQKSMARVHELDMDIIDGLWGSIAATEPGVDAEPGQPLPSLPLLTERDEERRDYGSKDMRSGFTLNLVLDVDSEDTLIFDNRDNGGRGIALTWNGTGYEFYMSDGQYSVCAPILLDAQTRPAKLAILVDGGPKIISAVCDGRFASGGDTRQFGWTRFSGYVHDVNSREPLRMGSRDSNVRLSIYNRCLTVSEAAALHGYGQVPG